MLINCISWFKRETIQATHFRKDILGGIHKNIKVSIALTFNNTIIIVDNQKKMNSTVLDGSADDVFTNDCTMDRDENMQRKCNIIDRYLHTSTCSITLSQRMHVT